MKRLNLSQGQGCPIPKLKKKLHNMLNMKKPTKQAFGGFIIPLVTHAIKAIKSNNAHKKRVKQQNYEKSDAGRKEHLTNVEQQGKHERENNEAYEKGLNGGKIRKTRKRTYKFHK